MKQSGGSSGGGSSEESHTHPGPELLEMGQRFGAWMDAEMRRRGLRNNDLAKASGLSNTYISVLRRGGVNNSGIYQRPSEEVVRKLCAAMEADEDLGRLAAGYAPRQVLGERDITLLWGCRYQLHIAGTEAPLEIELTPELLAELKIHSEVQRFRRKHASSD